MVEKNTTKDIQAEDDAEYYYSKEFVAKCNKSF
jgi:hypothetical protein